MGSEFGKYQMDVVGKLVKVSARSRGVHPLVFGCAFMGLLAVSVPVNAGYISPGTVDPNICANTASFATYNDCVGQVSDPKVEANGDPSTLVNYLNGASVDKEGTIGFIGFNDQTTPWGVPSDWLGISNQLNADVLGELPGTSTDGIFTVTTQDRYSGGWTFDLGNLLIDYLVVTVKDGGGWSGYYYDLTGDDLSIFSSTWDTLGITTGGGSGNAGPEVSHMYAAYIPGGDSPEPDPDPDPDPNPVPVPGTLVLLGLGLLTLRVSHRARLS